MRRKIIAIIGPARCGKSYLTKKLSEYYSAPAYFEGEEREFPPEIVDDLRNNIRPLERFLYFRNRTALNLLHALEDSAKHPLVFLDTCWLTNRPWIDVYETTPLEKELLRGICDVDEKTQPWPSAIVYLTADITTSKKLMNGGDRSFEKEFEDAMTRTKEAFKTYMATLPHRVPVIEVDRSELEFDNPDDLKKITERIDAL